MVHTIFSTQNREPILFSDIQPEVFAYLATILRNNGHQPISVGGHLDHVHLLFVLSKTQCIADMVEDIKVGSSKWIKTKGRRWENFHWQAGYAAYGISEADVPSVDQYIRNQSTHHTEINFQDELRKLLKENGVDYNEQFIWS